MTFRLLISLLVVLASCLSPPIRAEGSTIPADPNGFTLYAAGRATVLLPGMKVTVTGPLELKIGDFDTRLDTPFRNCSNDRKGCSYQIDSYLGTIPSLVEQAADTRPADLRVAVRSVRYIDDVIKSTAGNPEAAPIVRPIAGDIAMICVVDTPRAIRMLTHDDLTKLGLTEDQAITLGLNNVAALLGPLSKAAEPVTPTIKATTGEFYNSSRLLLHDQWSDISKAMGRHLVVAVPSSEILVFGNGTTDGARIARIASGAARDASKPISDQLYHWTPTGWEVVTP
jgi:hypothetical protein